MQKKESRQAAKPPREGMDRSNERSRGNPRDAFAFSRTSGREVFEKIPLFAAWRLSLSGCRVMS
jgi:hypothetical protein